MIFKKALHRELSFTTGGVFLVLVTIMITTLVIRILGYAANGAVNPKDALVLIALATLGYMAVLLTVSLFVAVLIVLFLLTIFEGLAARLAGRPTARLSGLHTLFLFRSLAYFGC